MQSPLEEARRGEYYGERRVLVPTDEECVGQDLINRQKLDNQEVGPATQGYSSDAVLALMDPREFAVDSETFTKQILKLAGPGLNRSRAVDTAIRRSDPARRKGIETNLITVAISIWQVRVGEVACTSVGDMVQNTLRLLQRVDFARTMCLEAVRNVQSRELCLEYFAFIERYYVRMYALPLRQQLHQKSSQLPLIWDTTESL